MIYTVHVKNGDETATNARFVRDGFSWGALVFGPLWLAYNRVWRGLIGWVIVASLLYAAARFFNLPDLYAAMLSELLSLYLGFEGNGLLRAALERRGWPVQDVAYGRKVEDAELSFFSRWNGFGQNARRSDAPVSRAPIAGTSVAFAQPQENFLGLFPESHQ